MRGVGVWWWGKLLHTFKFLNFTSLPLISSSFLSLMYHPPHTISLNSGGRHSQELCQGSWHTQSAAMNQTIVYTDSIKAQYTSFSRREDVRT